MMMMTISEFDLGVPSGSRDVFRNAFQRHHVAGCRKEVPVWLRTIGKKIILCGGCGSGKLPLYTAS